MIQKAYPDTLEPRTEDELLEIFYASKRGTLQWKLSGEELVQKYHKDPKELMEIHKMFYKEPNDID